VFAVGAAVCAGLLVEGFCRVAEPMFDVLRGPFELEDVPEPAGLPPNTEVEHLEARTTTNAGGYQGAYHPPTRTEDTLRVAVLGDSFTFGWGVEGDEAWPALLERRLDGAFGDGGDAEVLNFGVPGYNTWLALQTWRGRAREYAPDVVLLGYYTNDVEIDRRVPNVHRLCPLDGPAGARRWTRLTELSALARVIDDLRNVRRFGSSQPTMEGPGALAEDHHGFACSMLWAEELASEVEAAGARFAVVQLPHMQDLSDPEDPERAGQERLAAALGRREIRSFSLYPGLAGLDPEHVNNVHQHPNAAGHQAIAAVVWTEAAAWLLEGAPSGQGQPDPGR